MTALAVTEIHGTPWLLPTPAGEAPPVPRLPVTTPALLASLRDDAEAERRARFAAALGRVS